MQPIFSEARGQFFLGGGGECVMPATYCGIEVIGDFLEQCEKVVKPFRREN